MTEAGSGGEFSVDFTRYFPVLLQEKGAGGLICAHISTFVDLWQENQIYSADRGAGEVSKGRGTESERADPRWSSCVRRNTNERSAASC